MRDYATNDVILFQSTYARNPVSLAAVDVTLDLIKKGYVHSSIRKVGNALMKGIQELFNDNDIYDVIVQGYPSMFQLLFTKQDTVHNYRDFIKCDRDLFAKLQERLLEKGIMVDEYNGEAWYMSASHDLKDDRTLEAFQEILPLLSESTNRKLQKKA